MKASTSISFVPSVEGNELLKFLDTLFSSRKSLEERKKVLSEEYGLELDEEMEGTVKEMCNLSDGVYMAGYDSGVAEGELRGKQIGEQIGELRGKQIGEQIGELRGELRGKQIGEQIGRILGTVETMRDNGNSDEQIIERLMLKYGLTKEDAEGYVFVPA